MTHVPPAYKDAAVAFIAYLRREKASERWHEVEIELGTTLATANKKRRGRFYSYLDSGA